MKTNTTGNGQPENSNSGTLKTGLYHGDCRQLLPQVPDHHVDLIVTDPPYLVDYQDRTGRSIANDKSADWLEASFKQMYRALKPNSYCVTNYGWNRVHLFQQAWEKAGFRAVAHLVWVKNYTSKSGITEARHEMAYVLAKGNPKPPTTPLLDVLAWRYSGNKLHPTQKPVMALEPIIKSLSHPGALVLDPFAGSGTTAIAAWKQRRRFLGMEVDAEYYGIARKRLNRYIARIKQQRETPRT